jgi:photosystem II stability/assembly factor-like uncharacterized protein
MTMNRLKLWATIAVLLGTHLCSMVAAETGNPTPLWEPTGWGGGGFYWAAAFHPSRDGTIYMGGDVGGVYKTEDHGRHWRMINQGLTNYAVYSLAVDRRSPETVYAATVGGLCKSTDGGEHWQFLPKTGPQDLRITAERNRSVHAIAVDPTQSDIVYAGNVDGKIYKSTDGGQTWTQVYQVLPPTSAEPAPPPTVLRAQFGGVSKALHGGFWIPLVSPSGDKAKDCQGLGFSFKGNGAAPKTAMLDLWTSDGAVYKSKNLSALFEKTDWQDVWLTGDDFTLDASRVRQQPEKAKSWPQQPDWQKANRLDFGCVNMNNAKPSVALLGMFYFAPGPSANEAVRLVARDFAKDKTCHAYGNVATGAPEAPKAGTIFSVAVAQQDPAIVLAATEMAGVVLSEDAGQTWRALATPKKATSVVVAATDVNLLVGSFAAEGVWKSTDKGKTWLKSSAGIKDGCEICDVAVSAVNVQDIYAIGSVGWSGYFYASSDGGSSWNEVRRLTCDRDANPTDPTAGGNLSRPTNVAICPSNPRELFLSANWRPCLSEDGGRTWSERDRGADITCFEDLRFHGNRVYATAMDEGALVSEDNGSNWRQLWPQKYDAKLVGHVWRLAIGDAGDKDRVLATCSPWEAGQPNYVTISEDGGETFHVAKTGLPDYRPTANTMWGMSYPRGLAVDPSNPKVIYLGMDGDPTNDKCGGGVFKTADGGYTWKQLARQPGSRRVFFGLAIDPTNPKRLYWGACGTGGGLWRSEDSGESWQLVFKNSDWIFNVLVTADGTVYCPEKDLWRSTDHGNSWQQLTHFPPGSEVIVGLEVDPRTSKTLWISRVTWSDRTGGGVHRTCDGGGTWQDITGNLPYRKPICLRFNSVTNELWAAGVGVYKIKQ